MAELLNTKRLVSGVVFAVATVVARARVRIVVTVAPNGGAR